MIFEIKSDWCPALPVWSWYAFICSCQNPFWLFDLAPKFNLQYRYEMFYLKKKKKKPLTEFFLKQLCLSKMHLCQDAVCWTLWPSTLSASAIQVSFLAWAEMLTAVLPSNKRKDTKQDRSWQRGVLLSHVFIKVIVHLDEDLLKTTKSNHQVCTFIFLN